MARKDHGSSGRDRCDICGTALDDRAVVQEFPDGSVVSLCADCATGSGPEEEVKADDATEADDATVEWVGPRDDSPTAPAPALFEPEVFDSEEYEPAAAAAAAAAAAPLDAVESEADITARAEAQLAAWASAHPEEEPRADLDEEYVADFDEEEAEEATLQLMAAIAEADMEEEAEEGQLPLDMAPMGAEPEAAEAEEAEPEAAEAEPGIPALPTPADQTATPETVDKTKEELLMPIADLLALQTEMQSALAKLSSTLEHFVADLETSAEHTETADERVKRLEDELESTRERLRLAETLLPESALDAAAALAAATATADKDLLGKPGAPGAAAVAGAAAVGAAAGAAVAATPVTETAPPSLPPPPPLPPAAAGAAAPSKTTKSAASMVPPPLGAAVAAGAPPMAAPPPLPGLAAAGAAAVAGAAAGAIVPPPLGAAAAPKVVAPPPALKPPAPSAPTAKPQPTEVMAATPLTTRKTAVPKAPPTDGSDATAVDDLGMIAGAAALSAEPKTTPPVPLAGTVAGAAAAMQKLLRGRKGHQHAEPEPGPESQPEEPAEVPGLAFKINEVQAAQRYFNESEFVKKLGEISKSIGKSKANVSRTRPGAPEAAVTVFWDIVWYQYIIDLRKELPEDTERVMLAQEGMDLQELESRFTEKNATINDDGRLDASELEVRLLSDPEALIHNLEVSSPEERLAEDATEEIWDQQSAPEFRWD